jgi:hypothetical protein
VSVAAQLEQLEQLRALITVRCPLVVTLFGQPPTPGFSGHFAVRHEGDPDPQPLITGDYRPVAVFIAGYVTGWKTRARIETD